MPAESFSPSSTCVQSASYDPETQVLEVTFARDGSTYTYTGVPAGVWADFQSAPSAGRFVRQVLAGVYGYGT